MTEPYGVVDNDGNFQILDFQETLQKCIQDDQKIYGHKNKPRKEEPSMFQMLTWNDAEGDNWNYTVKNKNILESSLTNQLKYRINKSSSNWTTENMDQFRKFTYSPSKQPVFYDLHDPANARVRLTTSQGPDVSRNLAEQLARSSKGLHPHQHQIALDKASETADKYTVQNMRNLNDVLKVIEGRAINKAGEVVRNPVAQQVTGRAERPKQGGHYTEDGEYYDEEQYEGQEGQDEDESEQIEVEKLDLSNVKSRLLEKKVKTAKKLDPVYEKERLDRRKERIKRLNETTRWLPNSAFKTYFGKAPFENYGRGNINPTVGGSVYGDYLKSHNVNPHAGGNKPQYKQVYAHADFASTRYPDPQPEPPRKCKDDYRLSQKQVDELKRRNPLVGEKFREEPKTIVKPDLVNSLRFASEENTPEQSFEEEKPKKSKNLRESLKNLGKKARAIREETTKSNKSVKAERTKSATRSPDALRSPQPSVQESTKAASAKKPTSATLQTKKVSSTPQVPKKTAEEPKRKTVKIEEQDVVPQERSQKKLNRVAQQQADLEDFRNSRTEPTKAELEHEHYERIKAFNASEVGSLMRDPASALQAQPRISQSQEQSRKAVTFKEAPAPQQRGQQLSYGKVEDLPTLIKEAQKNEKLIEKINEDMGGTLNVNPMQPPKNYLFSLSQKETDPRYYKNVPSVWLQRIPFAGKQSGKHEDIKGVFGTSD